MLAPANTSDPSRPTWALLGVTAVAVPLFGFVAMLDPVHPAGWPARFVIAALCLGLMLGVHRSPFIARWFRYLGLLLACGIYVFFGLRALRAGIPTGQMVSLMLIASLTVTTLVRMWEVVLFLVFVIAAGAVGYELVDDPVLPALMYNTSMACLVLGIGWVSTSRAHLEEALRDSQTALEDRVAERTEALRLEVAERSAAELEAVAASRAKSRFLANMSHELRTPLNAVTGYTELVREELIDTGQAELTEDLDKVLSSATHLVGMINDLLDLSRIEAGELELKPEDVDVQEVVDELVRLLAPEQQRSGATVQVEVADVHLRTDRLRLSQIGLNLLTNALKFAPGGDILVRAGPSERGVRIEIEDNGVGIEPGHLELIFDRFAQVDESFTRRAQGAGLGLALCKNLAARLGGDLTVQSQPGEGSTFTLELSDLPA